MWQSFWQSSYLMQNCRSWRYCQRLKLINLHSQVSIFKSLKVSSSFTFISLFFWRQWFLSLVSLILTVLVSCRSTIELSDWRFRPLLLLFLSFLNFFWRLWIHGMVPMDCLVVESGLISCCLDDELLAKLMDWLVAMTAVLFVCSLHIGLYFLVN